MEQQRNNHLSKTQIWTPFLLMMALVGGMLIGRKMNAPIADISKPSVDIPPSSLGQGRVEEIIRYIDAQYVDEVNESDLADDAIKEILKDLDPHSNYIPARQLAEINEQLEGNFDGIGIEFMMLDDTIMVISPLLDGPSDKAGLLSGDKMIKIEGEIVAGVEISDDDIRDKLRGKAGSKVMVSIKRYGEDKLLNYTITRARIPVPSVDVYYMLDEETGYIKVNRFSATTHEEFMEGVDSMVQNGMKDLIIDLRHNPGGYLQEATKMLSQLFEEKGKLLVYTKGEHAPRHDYNTTGRAWFEIKDIAVLIDEGSASASEIMAGAIQDHDRGWIIGRRSFGKGLVQEQYDLRDGSALRLTVARYYTPSGRSIQKQYDGNSEYDNDVSERYDTGELFSKDSVQIADSTEYFTTMGRKVFAGGGITPEIFVPLDTLQLRPDYIDLRQHIPAYVFRYLDVHRGDFSTTELKDYLSDFAINDNLWNDFLSYAKGKGDVYTATQVSPMVSQELKLILKARIAKHLYDDLGFYEVVNQDDPFVAKALNVLHSRKPIVEK